jgi:hypothetical protein
MISYEVIIKTDLKDRPKDHELSAALILARYFKSDVIFLRPNIDKTPDIEVNGTKWEIKSPKGNSKKTIENNLRTARKQSKNIIIDLRRTKLHQTRALNRINYFLSKGHRFKKVLIITKSNIVIVII